MKYYITDITVAEQLSLTASRHKAGNGLYVLNSSDLAPLDVEKLTAEGKVREISRAEARKTIKRTRL